MPTPTMVNSSAGVEATQETYKELRPDTWACTPNRTVKVSEMQKDEQEEKGPTVECHTPTTHATQPTQSNTVLSVCFGTFDLKYERTEEGRGPTAGPSPSHRHVH